MKKNQFTLKSPQGAAMVTLGISGILTGGAIALGRINHTKSDMTYLVLLGALGGGFAAGLSASGYAIGGTRGALLFNLLIPTGLAALALKSVKGQSGTDSG